MNKVILMGRLTRDPEVRQVNQDNMVSNFSLAVNRRFAKQGEERQADFINVIAWGKLAEFSSKWIKKGQQVSLIGRIQTRTWDDQNGQRRYATEVVAEEIYFAEGKRDTESNFQEAFTNPMPADTTANDFQVTTGDDLPF